MNCGIFVLLRLLPYAILRSSFHSYMKDSTKELRRILGIDGTVDYAPSCLLVKGLHGKLYAAQVKNEASRSHETREMTRLRNVRRIASRRACSV